MRQCRTKCASGVMPVDTLPTSLPTTMPRLRVIRLPQSIWSSWIEPNGARGCLCRGLSSMSDEAPDLRAAIGFLIFDNVEELDFIGPWEVFGSARECGAELRLLSIAERSGIVRCAHGVRVEADCVLSEAPPLAVLVIPGGSGTRQAAANEAILDWIREAANGARWVVSVCTGARLLAQTGLTAGRTMTTHWQFSSELAQRPDIHVVEDRRYVFDGK